MKIVIPMAGKGKRFNDFLSPKPLIEIDGKPMIEHVVNYFPRDSTFVFICNKEHLKNTEMESVLNRIAPECRIISVDDSMLKGPAYSTLAAFEYIDDDEEIIVNYCDFIQVWDFNNFMKSIRDKKPSGAIITFKGFHPSSLSDTYYAYAKVNKDNFITDLKEKSSFSKDKMEDFASTGCYYFSSGKIMKKYINKLVSNQKYTVNGEFYMSLPYLLMIKDNLKVLNYEVPKFICLGIPRDYELYRFWSEFFSTFSPDFINFNNVTLKVINVFPLASGKRTFAEIGIKSPDFLLPLMNKTLIEYSLDSHPKAVRNIFLLLESEKDYFLKLPLSKQPNSEMIISPSLHNTLLDSLSELKKSINKNTHVCICGSDYLLEYNERKLANLMENDDVEIILFSFSHHEHLLRAPDKFIYAELKNNIEIKRIVGKGGLSGSPYNQHSLCGAVLIKKSKYLFENPRVIENSKIDSSDYIASLTKLIEGKKAVIFEVDKFVPLKTVHDFKEFTYWQDYFHSLAYHPYSKTIQ